MTAEPDRVAFRMRIKPGREADYDKAHSSELIWPSIVEACRRAGFRNYSLFRDGTDVFGYFEADDAERSMAALAADPANEPWQEHMAPLMAVPGSFEAGSDVRTLVEIFHLH